MLRPVALLSALVVAGPAAAEYQRIQARESFVSIVKDRDLTRLGIRLNVTEDGRIVGKAFGQNVSGGWHWKGGYFCRDLYLNGDIIDGDNCQTVEVRGDRVRFTSDQGRGDSAELSLR